MEDNLLKSKIISCPYLGLEEDPATHQAFPSVWNFCQHVSPLSTPKFSHQQSVCLQPIFKNCPVYQAQPGHKMPKELSYRPTNSLGRRRVVLAMIIFVIIVILILFGFVFRAKLFQEFIIPPVPIASPTPVFAATKYSTITNTTEPVQEVVIEIDIIPTQNVLPPTNTPTAIAIAQEKPLLILDKPIGKEYQFKSFDKKGKKKEYHL